MSLIAAIKSDYRCYRHPLLAQGFWATFAHRLCTAGKSIPIPGFRLLFGVIHVLLSKMSEIFFGIYIGRNVVMGEALTIEHFGGIIVHANTQIGNGVRLRQGVTLGNKSAAEPDDAPILCDGVDVGAGAKILGKIVIGENAVIGANAVVVGNVPAGAIAVGVPARIVLRKNVAPAAAA